MVENYPKTVKIDIELRLRQDLADRLPEAKGERNTFINQAVENELNGINDAASRLGKKGGATTSERKALAARENAKKPRPRNKD